LSIFKGIISFMSDLLVSNALWFISLGLFASMGYFFFTESIKKFFVNEETIVFSLILVVALAALSLFGSVLSPFLVSIIVAYLLVGFQVRLEGYGLKTSTALIVTYIFFLVITTTLLVYLVPLIYQQLQSLVLESPRLFNELIVFIQAVPSNYPDLISSEQVTSFFEGISAEITGFTQNLVKSSITGITGTITFAMYLILFPVLVYFFLFDRKNIINSFMAIIPGERKMLSNVWLEMDNQLSNYVRGKSIEILIVAVTSAIIFASLGLNYTALLSVLVGVSVLIPYVGAFLVTIPVLVVGLIQFGLSADFYILTGLYLLLQALDGNLLVPLIFSDAVKLHPVIIILAVFIFGSMFGFWGVFLAIPIATFIKAIWNAWPSQA
jgi:putative permease